ncbi:hypothetical protein HXX76_002458 [Chlamydomonas incerta]|uniref:RAP domain-containing protein n=1 Tax=Chlamydomonas incerta TaxID=51695 RepID=A0A835TBD6_CHLIN|nr:hypothetical protein HXX76_002458 [Chlamydomonas incerta]|eukprot:KAG2442372.1 hypothetical protein HXX76_002458 [Chlamydomonas incerta]
MTRRNSARRAPAARPPARPPAPRSVLGDVRGAGLEQWAELVRLYGDPAAAAGAAAAGAAAAAARAGGAGARKRKGSGLGGVFAADALFRAAHFVDGDGRLHSNPLESWRTQNLAPKAGAGVTTAAAAADNVADLPRGAPAAQLIDAAQFSELVQQLLPAAADAAEAGQLGSMRGARVLWALAKLSASAGEAPGAGEGEGQQQGDRLAKGPASSGGAAPLPLAAMRQHGARCAVALAAQLLREASQAQQPPGADAAQPPAPAASSSLAPGESAPAPGESAPAAAPATATAESSTSSSTSTSSSYLSSGRNVVMVMWSLARLSAAGFLPGHCSAAGGVASSVRRGHLWQALSAALLPHLPAPGATAASPAAAAAPGAAAGLPARELSNALWALATARECNAAVFPALVAAMEPHLAAAGAAPLGGVPVAGGRCNAQDIVNTVWALARAGTDPEARVMRLAEAAVLRAAPQLRAQHVASLLWSFSVLRYAPVLRPQALAVPVSSGRNGGGGRGGGGGGGRPADLYQVLAKRAGELRMWWSGGEDQLAQVVWALVRMHEPPARVLVTPPLLAAAAERLAAGASRLSLREAAMVACAYRDARFPHPALFAALLRRAGELPERQLGGAAAERPAAAAGAVADAGAGAGVDVAVGVSSPHVDVSIALLLRGLAWAGAYDQAVYSRLCSALRRHHLAAIAPQPLAMTLWALARVRHRQPDFLAAATFVATAIVSRFRGGELATAALALATLGVRSAAFFDAAAVALTTLRGSGRAHQAQELEAAGAKLAAAAGRGRDSLVPGEPPLRRGVGGGRGLDSDPDEAADEELDAGLEAGEDDDGDGDDGRDERGAAGAAQARSASAGRRGGRRGGRRYWVSKAVHEATQRDRWRLVELLNPQELANVMAAFATSGHVDETLYYRAQIRAQRLLKASSVLREEAASAAAAADMTTPSAAASASGPASTGPATATATARALRAGDPVAAVDMSAAAVVKLLWAFVAVGATPSDTPLLAELAARVRQLLWRLEPRDIASLAWALATSRQGLEDCADLLHRAVSAAGAHAPAFSPRELATVAWAAASCGRRDDRLMAACRAVVLGGGSSSSSSSSGGSSSSSSSKAGGGAKGAGAGGERRRARGAGDGDRVVLVASSVDEDDDDSGGAAIFPGPLPGGAAGADVATSGSGGGAAGAAGAAGRAAAGLTVQVLSDVAWSHSALRLYSPELLAAVAAAAAAQLNAAADALARQQQLQQLQFGGSLAAAADGDGDDAAGGLAAAESRLTAPQPDLQHVVALLEAFAVWAAGAPGDAAGSDGAGGEGGGGCCYDDRLFRAAARVLLARADELTNEEVVTVVWCCAMVLHALPRPAPAHPHPQARGGGGGGGAGAALNSEAEAEHPVLLLLGSLSGLLGGMRPDSFLQPELVQLAQARVACREYAATAAAAAADAATAGLAVHNDEAAATWQAAPEGPLRLPPALRDRLAGVWGAAPAARTRRAVVELCAALHEAGFRDVCMDARCGLTLGAGLAQAQARGPAQAQEEAELVPVEVAALAPPAAAARKPGLPQHGQGSVPCGGGGGGGERGDTHYAFLVAGPDHYAVGQPGVLWGAHAARARMLEARGWRVVVVPLPTAQRPQTRRAGPGQGRGSEGGGGGSGGGGHQVARETREHVLGVLRAALGPLAGSEAQ